MFNDISRYLDDIFTINNLEFEKHIEGNFNWTEQILQTKKILSFFIYNNVIGNNVHTSVYDKHEDFVRISYRQYFLIDYLDSHPTVFTFLSWLHLLGFVLAFWISILKIFKSLPNYWHRVTDITSFEKHLESSSGPTRTFNPNLVKYCFEIILFG